MELPELTAKEQALIHEVQHSDRIYTVTVERYLRFWKDRKTVTDALLNTQLQLQLQEA